MQKKYMKTIRLVVVFAIIGAFVWFLVLSPMITFRNNEKVLKDAAVRYFELNKEQLPTGERVKTLSLNTLYKKAYLKEDFKAPYSNNLCSLENSWVKVRRENGEYKYYAYLDCGFMKSSIDHTGPQIKLEGKEDMTVNMGEEFTDPGVKSVVDDTDGKLDTESVTVKGEVNTKKAGTYEIVYTAFDSFSNKTEVTRKVKVVKSLISTVKKDLGDETNYKGYPGNNFVLLSNMLFMIYGIDSNNNVILVQNEDISNVNFYKIDKWLDEVYLEHFTDEAKKFLVKSKFCDMTIKSDEDLKAKACKSYTKERYAYIPSNVEVNLAEEKYENFMKPFTMSWVAAKKDSKQAYLTRGAFYGKNLGDDFYLEDANDNYGVRPMIVVKGNTLITSGDGSENNPYSFGDTKKAKGGTLLNKRYPGEYITSNGYIWRIMEVEDDGTIKVISNSTLKGTTDIPKITSMDESSGIKYDPKNKNSHAYKINNQASEYIDISIFTTHEISIPVYKKNITYGEVEKYNKYKVKLSAPCMHDMFSAQAVAYENNYSYWLCDTVPSAERKAGAVTDIGVPVDEIPAYYDFGMRVVGFLKKDTVISSGAGTINSPYKLK